VALLTRDTTAAQLDSFVIGLELCPFAGAARRATRVVCCRAEGWPGVQATLTAELRALDEKSRDEQATTLVALLHPVYRSFDAYMDVHSQAEALGQELTRALVACNDHCTSI
jgi:hypothetical protein